MGKLKKYIIPISAIIFFYIFLRLLGIETNCYFKAILGIPCPGCGLTRAYLALLKGNLKEAFYYHPLFIVPVIVIIYILISKIRKYKNNMKFWLGICALFIVTWIIRMVLLFPSHEPMVFYKAALFPSIYAKLRLLLKI